MAVYTGDMNKDDFWAKTGKTQSKMGFAAEGVINDNLSGNAMDAYGVRSREALARSEANSRANTAAQIQRAGFAGTPIGAGAANAYEAAMLQNRFANNLDIEVQRQDMRRQGVNMAMDYANNANRFGFEQAQEGRAGDVHQWNTEDRTQSKFGDAILANPNWVNKSKEELAADPEFMNYAQSYWEATNGGPMAGKVDMDWAMERVAAANHPELRNPYYKEQKLWGDFVDSYQWPEDTPPETITAMKQFPLIAMGQILGFTLDFDEDGIPTVRSSTEEEKVDKAKEIVAGIKSGTIPFKDYPFEGEDDPVYKGLLDSKIPEGTGEQTASGKDGGTIFQNWAWIVDVGRKTSYGYTGYERLEKAYSDGSPVNIDGKLYYVDSINRTDGYLHESVVQAGLNFFNPFSSNGLGTKNTGYTTYTLVNPADGKTITKSTSREEWH